MRTIFLTAVSSVLLAACGASNPNDGTQYFDSITPNATTMEAEQKRLENAENVTLLPQTDTASQTVPIVPLNPQGSATISDTQDFEKTKQRETRQSDAAKIAALKGTYQQVAPTAVPTRRDGVNLASYALKQSNAVGEKVYSRFNVGLSNCNKYRNDPDAAQQAFLAAGGPQRDRKRLDPDGDGFACNWNPDFYRNMLKNNG